MALVSATGRYRQSLAVYKHFDTWERFIERSERSLALRHLFQCPSEVNHSSYCEPIMLREQASRAKLVENWRRYFSTCFFCLFFLLVLDVAIVVFLRSHADVKHVHVLYAETKTMATAKMRKHVDKSKNFTHRNYLCVVISSFTIPNRCSQAASIKEAGYVHVASSSSFYSGKQMGVLMLHWWGRNASQSSDAK